MRKIISLSLIICALTMITIGIYLGTKFKNITVELGDSITKEDFISYGMTSNVNIDLSNIRDAVGKYIANLRFSIFNYDLTVTINDTKAPELEVKDVYETLGYEININDFIVNVSDKSEYTLSYSGEIDSTKYGKYEIEINAKDVYGNNVAKKANLNIGWIRNEYTVEVGTIVKAMDLVYDKSDINTIIQSNLDDINNKGEGTYYLESVKDNISVQVKISKTKDLTPPDLVLKDVTIYEGKKINNVNSFVSKVSDKSNKTEVKLLTDIDYSKIGEQIVKIEASDIYGNKVEKEAKLKIIKDKIGPVISGLSKLTVNKGTVINYTSGVSANDENTGKCQVRVDSSKVNTSKYGTYYAIYTATDALGNTTTAKRVIAVNHDKEDTDALVKKIASTLPNDAEKIRDYVRNNVKYNTNWGGNDPVWYGLNSKAGNCFVHANIFQALLKEKGFDTKLIWTTNKTHYWNMVYLNGKWYHMDSTPTANHMKYSIMNDQQRKAGLSGRDWDRSAWPKVD